MGDHEFNIFYVLLALVLALSFIVCFKCRCIGNKCGKLYVVLTICFAKVLHILDEIANEVALVMVFLVRFFCRNLFIFLVLL